MSAPDFRALVAAVASDSPAVKLRWRSYSTVVELRAEYSVHLETLRDERASPGERVTALLHSLRLQLCSAANTFCWPPFCCVTRAGQDLLDALLFSLVEEWQSLRERLAREAPKTASDEHMRLSRRGFRLG